MSQAQRQHRDAPSQSPSSQPPYLTSPTTTTTTTTSPSSPYLPYSPSTFPPPRSTSDLLRAGVEPFQPRQQPPAALRATTLIPRDYLSQRSDVPHAPAAAGCHSINPIASPFRSVSLQHSNPRSPRVVSPILTRDLSSPSSSAASPSASGTVPLPQPAHSSAFPVPPSTIFTPGIAHRAVSQQSDQNPQLRGALQRRGTMSDATITEEQSRKASSPVPRASSSATSNSPSPSLTNPAVASVIGERGGHRTMPRTSSIDSAISSISSPSHSHKSSVDSTSISPADIANLIAAAGSAEAVIIHLLKEKQNAAAQNAQLWRLVDKQRTMVLGLNKDLERALKDKDRYRKKLKELQNLPPPLPNPSGEQGGRADNGPPKSAAPITRTKSNSDATIRTPVDELAMFPSPLHVNHAQSNPSFRKTDTPDSTHSTPTDTHGAGFDRKLPLRQVEESMLENHSARHKDPGNEANMTSQTISTPVTTPTASGSKASPTTDQKDKVLPPARRPPPAPLDLSRAERPVVQATQETRSQGSDSEYDDVLEVDEIPTIVPTVDRGRRKTREEDDREREVMVLKEQAARSKSNKKKLKTIQPPESVQKNQAQGFPGMGLPASPRTIMPGSPGISGRASPPESIASMLSPPGSETGSSDNQRPVLSPPMSPGLPLSPRPGDRPIGSPLPRMPKDGQTPLTSPQFSPRNGLPLSPRPHMQTGPPRLDFPEQAPASQADRPQQEQMAAPMQAERQIPEIPTFAGDVKIDSPRSPRSFKASLSIYRGLVTEEYPDLLLPPNALSSIDIKVSSSRLRPSRHSYLALKPSEEEPVFTLSVFSRANRAELWRVEKVIQALPQLDQQLKQISNFGARLPDRSIFSGHSPAKVDARRAALNSYFNALLETPMDEATALVLCQFLTLDAIEPRDDETSLVNGASKGAKSISLGPDGKPRMEGYLTKRGKNFGGWKARYFVLHGPELKYFESPGGAHMGTIKIQHAQIGKQSQGGQSQSPSRNDDDDNQYRHAFLVLEPKKKDSTAFVRHVLCAESDHERDAWVEILLSYVEDPSSDDENASRVHQQQQRHEASLKSRLLNNNKKGSKGTDSPEPEHGETLRSMSYDDMIAAEAPVRGADGGKPRSNAVPEHLTQVGWDQAAPPSPSLKNISGPTNGTKIQDVGLWGNKIPTLGTKEKKRSIWGFRATSSTDLGNQSHNSNASLERKEPVRAVFGLPLAEAVEFCGPRDVDSGLPAVVYRCIEYLRAKNAALEEGIFRLSGSNVVIKALKERFNTEGDLDFLDGDHYYDVHAVASLFKQYLRELPSTVLTRELHLDFIRVLADLDDKPKKIAAFHTLVHRLPRANLILLRALSQFLIVIISNSDVNKMTVRNVGIVFAPTLNIPAPVFAMFLTDFDSIFGDPPEYDDDPPAQVPVELTVNQTLSAEDIRSPRHQMFTDLPTPGYAQQSFHDHDASSGPHRDPRENYDTGFIPMQPTYEQHVMGDIQPPPQRHGSGDAAYHQYGSMGSMLTPSGNNRQSTKAKRRESNLLFMSMANRRSAVPKPREGKSMVSEDSAFE
ncbi:hypothetical protein AJ80_07385 [Polytolypa hystricis UAMH7299]|uniref:RalA-binding protein 1 n=1 Tax=Polytolypa hystricis (strain UAMH7299) TaxID=1447883 RepID=A0A2B7XGI2_POLH7|nr:hypothetical protein AJ80_07385 [Polytolypa hystricis UAMH7299]